MTLYLKNYRLPARMCIVAKDKNLLRELNELRYEVMFINDNSITLYPDEISIELSQTEQEQISRLADRDIVELYNNGLLYRSFANMESDTTLFLGAKCNSNCIMCSSGDNERKKGNSFTSEHIEKYISYLPKDIDFLVITGGEPTLNTELFLFSLKKIREKFIDTQVLLLTNGRTLSNNEFLDKMCAVIPYNFTIDIPIHGSTKELHDYITGTPGSFEQTLTAIKKLLKRNITVEIRIIVTKTNCDDLIGISEMIAKEFSSVKCVYFVGLEPRGNCAKNRELVYIDHKTAFEKIKPAINYLIKNAIDVEIYNFPLCSVERGYWIISKKSISGYKNVYHEKCENCDVKDLCCGLFQAELSFIRPDVYPINIKNEANV